jgi:FtsZ-binding cell division protein ZapB
MKIKTILAVALLAITTSSTMAQVRPVKANRAKIKQGVQSGELNRAEAARLKAQNVKLGKEVKDARADGVVTTEERKEIKQDKKQLNRRIYRQKHDAQTAH